MQLFFTIKHFYYQTKIPMKIPKLPNKISRIINITYLISNNKIYKFFFKKKALNRSLRVKSPYYRSNNPTIETKFDTVQMFFVSSRMFLQNFT